MILCIERIWMMFVVVCAKDEQNFSTLAVTCITWNGNKKRNKSGTFCAYDYVGAWCYYVRQCGGVMDRVICCDASFSFFWFSLAAAMDTWTFLSARLRLWNCWVSSHLFLIYTVRWKISYFEKAKKQRITANLLRTLAIANEQFYSILKCFFLFFLPNKYFSLCRYILSCIVSKLRSFFFAQDFNYLTFGINLNRL